MTNLFEMSHLPTNTVILYKFVKSEVTHDDPVFNTNWSPKILKCQERCKRYAKYQWPKKHNYRIMNLQTTKGQDPQKKNSGKNKYFIYNDKGYVAGSWPKSSKAKSKAQPSSYMIAPQFQTKDKDLQGPQSNTNNILEFFSRYRWLNLENIPSIFSDCQPQPIISEQSSNTNCIDVNDNLHVDEYIQDNKDSLCALNL